MRSSTALIALLSPGLAVAASWSFNDAKVTVQEKGAGIGAGQTESITANKALTAKAISLAPTDTLKVTLTARDGSSSRKPDQAFLRLQDSESGLDDAFPFHVKDDGKAKIELAQKDIPQQLLVTKRPIRASIILASFGSSTGYAEHAFDLAIQHDAAAPEPSLTPPERYGKKPEINHIFRDDPRSPPRIISLVFTLAVLGTLPILLGTWALLGANLSHASDAIKAQPIAHALFFGSVLAMEGVFVLYYASWTLFQAMPAVAVVGTVAYISGSRALTEVQERRLAGHR